MSTPIDTSNIEALACAAEVRASADAQSQSESTASRPSPFRFAQTNINASSNNNHNRAIPLSLLGSSSRFVTNNIAEMKGVTNSMIALSNDLGRRVSMPNISGVDVRAGMGIGIGISGFNDHVNINNPPPLSIRDRLPTDYELIANGLSIGSSSPVSMMPNRASINASPNAPPASAKKSRRKPNFAEKLHVVLSTSSNNHLAHWLPNGDAFLITDKIEFTKQILPKYMREAKFDSFARRMRRWGFVKRHTSKENQIVFMHELFKRDRFDLCKKMHGRDKTLEDDDDEEAVQQPMKNSHPSHPGRNDFGAVGTLTTSPVVNPTSAAHSTTALSTVNQTNNNNNNMMFQRRMTDMTPREYLLRRELMQTVALRREMEMKNNFQGGSLNQPFLSRGVITSQMPTQGPNFPQGRRLSPNNLLGFRGLPSNPQVNINRQGHLSLSPDIQATTTSPNNVNYNNNSNTPTQQLMDDIRECEEQLVLLQKLKELREKKRLLAESAARLNANSN